MCRTQKGKLTDDFIHTIGYTDAFLLHRFIEPSNAFQSKYKPDFQGWKVGRKGPLKLTYPATIGDGEMKVREV